MAISRTTRAFHREVNLAKKFEIEVMVQLSGEHQIQEALNLYDVNENTELVLFLKDKSTQPFPNSIQGWPSIDLNKRVMEKLKISGESPCKEVVAKSARMSLDYE